MSSLEENYNDEEWEIFSSIFEEIPNEIGFKNEL